MNTFEINNPEVQAIVFRVLFTEELFNSSDETYASKPRVEFKRDLAKPVMKWKAAFDKITKYVVVNPNGEVVDLISKSELKDFKVTEDARLSGEQRLSTDGVLEVDREMAKAFKFYLSQRDNLPLPESSDAFQMLEQFENFCNGEGV
jgi:hypothetical protein